MLDARQLDALAAVIEHGSFGAAARALSLTLAAVSLRIKSLEAALGQRLLVRGKQLRATPAGQALLGHVRQLRLMEADLLAALPGGAASAGNADRMQSLSVAVNADSLSGWFLPGVADAVQQHRLLLDIVVDDQDHTHDALKSGDVAGCVTTLAHAMRGCVAEPLGLMRYRCRRWRSACCAVRRSFSTARTRCRMPIWRGISICRAPTIRVTSCRRSMVSNWRSNWAWAGAWCPTCCWRRAAPARRCRKCGPTTRLT